MKKRCLYGKEKQNKMQWENSAKHLLLAIGLSSVAVYGDIPTGLIGGITNSSDAYSAFISPDSSLIPIAGLPLNAQIYSVALNASGIGLIGGQDTTGGYAGLVSPNGALSVLNLDLASGTISSASINNNSNGIVSGNDGSGNMFAALVSENGIITPLATPAESGFIRSTAINNDGIGLIGGEGLTLLYASYVTPGGALNTIDTTSLGGGHLNVAINDQGQGIIGGSSTLGAYAAFVTFGEATPSPLSPLPGGFSSFIGSVAINNSGVALIGGNDDSANMYAGLVNPEGVVTPLFDSPDQGQIVSVAINNSGAGLIGGYINSDLYAALVQPNGSVNSLILGEIPGVISSVAINDAGVGLIGGQGNSQGYLALAAPNGTVTVLDMTGQQNINSVALHNSLLEATTPQSVGPYSSGAYTQLAAAAGLNSRFVNQNRIWGKGKDSPIPIAKNNLGFNKESLLAQNSDAIPLFEEHEGLEKQNTIWLAPFGNYIHLSKQNSIPSYTNTIGGALLGYDRHHSNYLVGMAAGYAFNYIDYSEDIGHSKLQEEAISLYGAYYLNHFWFDIALWGGLYQLSNVRHTLSSLTSKSSTHGWILSPHLEMAFPWALDKNERYFIEPFFMLDWVNNWQDGYTERGASGFNLRIANLYDSLLQSEVGLRFYERFEYNWGDFFMEEKLSYMNQAPFGFNTTNTSFVGAASTFPILGGSTRIENLASAQWTGFFVPKHSGYPYGGFALQTTFNGNYQSYFASVFTGIDF